MTEALPDDEAMVARFEEFKCECRYWLGVFGLLDWEVYYRHERVEGCFGCYRADLAGRAATIILSSDVEGSDTEFYGHRDLMKTAFHEVAHILLSPFEYQAHRVLSDEDVSEMSHIVIRRLESAVFAPDYDRRFPE